MSIQIKKCRVCFSSKLVDILDLGHQPPANNLHKNEKKQRKFPLVLVICKSCRLAQLSISLSPKKLFNNYFWVTGTSNAAKEHAKIFCDYTSEFIKKKNSILEIE